MRSKNSKYLNYLLFSFAACGIIIISLTVLVYVGHSHIRWFTDIDKDYFGIFGEFIGGVVGTIFSIITTILVYITYNAQQKDVTETKRLLQKQIDLSIKPDLYFTNSSVYGFSRISDDGNSYALDFSNLKNANTDAVKYNTSVEMVNIGVGIAKNIEFYWEFNLKEIQDYLDSNFSDNPLKMASVEKDFVHFNIKGIDAPVFMGQRFYTLGRRFDILLSHTETTNGLKVLFPLPYLICYFMAIKLCIDGRLSRLNSFMALDDFPKCVLHLSYKDISDKFHKKKFNFLLSGHGSYLIEAKENGQELFGYELYAIEE